MLYPVTPANTESSPNTNPGATSRVSAMMGTLILYMLASVLIPYFKFVPMATIAAILGTLRLPRYCISLRYKPSDEFF